MLTSPDYIVRGYGADHRIVYGSGAVTPVDEIAERAETLLADPAYFAAFNLKTLRNTRIGNLLGLCALTLPTGVPMTGVMMMARPGDEARLLRLGAAAERALKA